MNSQSSEGASDVRLPREPMRLPPAALLALVFLATITIYWPGLSGPLLLDDVENIQPILEWREGLRSLESAVLDNRSGLLGRIIPMASFAFDAWLHEDRIRAWKLTNLLLHLFTAISIYIVLRAIAHRDPLVRAQPVWIPTIIVCVWMLLPINVSTVLYLVQRMAIWCALFMAIGIAAFIYLRARIEAGDLRLSLKVGVGVVVVAFTILATLSKENGVLLPALVALIELFYFRQELLARQTKKLKLTVLVLTLLAGSVLTLYTSSSESLKADYVGRDFSAAERVLSQPRVLAAYVRSIVIPSGPSLGIYHDDFIKSASLLSPKTTILAIIAWSVLLVIGWRMRVKAPGVLFGLLFFLTCHALEASFFPLELYFEHRNYLASVGILWAIASTCLVIVRAATGRQTRVRFQTVLPAAFLLAYAFSLHGRVMVWSSEENILNQELRYNQTSARVHAHAAAYSIRQGNMPSALRHIDLAGLHSGEREGATTVLWRMLATCEIEKRVSDTLMKDFSAVHERGISFFGMQAFELLTARIEGRICELDSPMLFLGEVGKWIEAAAPIRTWQESWRTRYNHARLMAFFGDLTMAQQQAKVAWKDSAENSGIGVFLFQVSASLEDMGTCATVFEVLKRRAGYGDYRLDEAVRVFGAALEASEAAEDRGRRQDP